MLNIYWKAAILANNLFLDYLVEFEGSVEDFNSIFEEHRVELERAVEMNYANAALFTRLYEIEILESYGIEVLRHTGLRMTNIFVLNLN